MYLLGVDCDEVYPGIVLGNGATVKKKEYLKKIGEYDGTEERIIKPKQTLGPMTLNSFQGWRMFSMLPSSVGWT